MEEINYNRRCACFVFLIISIICFYLSFEYKPLILKYPFLMIVAFNLFGLALSAFTASKPKIYNEYKNETTLDFAVEYLRLMALSLVLASIVYGALVWIFRTLSITNNLAYVIPGAGVSIYLSSHIDYLKKNLIHFFRIK